MAKNWIAGAIKHPGREKRAAAKAGMSTHAYMEKEAGSSKASPSAKAAANLGLRLEKMHGGGKGKGAKVRDSKGREGTFR